MSGMLETLLLQPTQVSHRPGRLAGIEPTVLQHEGADLLPMHALRLNGGGTGAHEISHRLMTLVRHPYRRQLSCP
jgi:hypothetical protein